jgi:hypothetical protein
MPENIKMLKNLWLDDRKTPKPHLDETKIEEMEGLLIEIMATQKMLLEITTRTKRLKGSPYKNINWFVCNHEANLLSY